MVSIEFSEALCFHHWLPISPSFCQWGRVKFPGFQAPSSCILEQRVENILGSQSTYLVCGKQWGLSHSSPSPLSERKFVMLLPNFPTLYLEHHFQSVF